MVRCQARICGPDVTFPLRSASFSWDGNTEAIKLALAQMVLADQVSATLPMIVAGNRSIFRELVIDRLREDSAYRKSP